MNEEEQLEYEDQEFEDHVKSLGDFIYLLDENGVWKKTYIGWCG